MDFMEKVTFLESIQTTMFSFSLLTTLPCNLEENCSTLSNFQSFRCLEKQIFQWPFLLVWSYKSTIQTSFGKTKAYQDGKETHKDLSPHHLSYQNFTFLSFPTKKEVLLLMPISFLMVFHNPTPYPSTALQNYHSPSSSSYFPLITCL